MINNDFLYLSLRGYFEAHGHIPTITEHDLASKEKIMPWRTSYRKCFGSWDKAVEAAGLSESHVKRNVLLDEEAMLQQLRDLGKELGWTICSY